MKEILKRKWKWILIALVAVLMIMMAFVIMSGPKDIDATFNVRNMEKHEEGFLMSIGEETLLEWETEPDLSGTEIILPKGLEKLGSNENGIRVRAVKVGKWKLAVKNENAEYVPEKEYFVCIGVTEEQAKENCE